jgi:hypothetical protein
VNSARPPLSNRSARHWRIGYQEHEGRIGSCDDENPAPCACREKLVSDRGSFHILTNWGLRDYPWVFFVPGPQASPRPLLRVAPVIPGHD